MFDLANHTADTLIMCTTLIICIGGFGLLLIQCTKLICTQIARSVNITYDYYESNLAIFEQNRDTQDVLINALNEPNETQ
jgi:hypothetical protein